MLDASDIRKQFKEHVKDVLHRKNICILEYKLLTDTIISLKKRIKERSEKLFIKYLGDGGHVKSFRNYKEADSTMKFLRKALKESTNSRKEYHDALYSIKRMLKRDLDIHSRKYGRA